MRRVGATFIAGLSLSLAAGLIAPANSATAQRGTTSSGVSLHDGKWIVFGEKTGIYKVRSDGTRKRAVVSRWGARYPSWSPSGRWIAFAQLSHYSYRNKRSYVALVRPSGKGLHRIARGWDPQWMPDGHHLLFHRDVTTSGPVPLYSVDVRTR